MEDLSYDRLVERAHNHLQTLTEAACGLWHIDKASWDVDQEQGRITFSRPDGVIATAPVQIVGTFNPDHSSWLWGWDHPAVREPLRIHAEMVRTYGTRNAIGELIDRTVSCTQADCWRFTALACYLNQAQGGYRGPTDGPVVFMTFGTVSLSSPGHRAV